MPIRDVLFVEPGPCAFAGAQTVVVQRAKLGTLRQPGTTTMKSDSPLQQDVGAERQGSAPTGVTDPTRIGPSVTATTAAAVKSDIEAALQRTSVADARQISVAVHGSDVTLSGSVRSWNERDEAIRSAWGTPGVSNVVDMLTLAD